MLTIKIGGNGLLYPTDEFGRVGAIWEVTPDQVVPNGTEEDISAEDVGWHYDEIAEDRAKEMRFDHRMGKRVISIPSGGQSRK